MWNSIPIISLNINFVMYSNLGEILFEYKNIITKMIDLIALIEILKPYQNKKAFADYITQLERLIK